MINLAGPQLMQDSAARLAKTANNIANANTPGYQRLDPNGTSAVTPPAPQTAPIPTNNVDLGTEMVNMIQAENAYSLGAKLVTIADDIAQETLDMVK